MMEKKLKAMKLANQQAKDCFLETGQLNLEYVVNSDSEDGWMFKVGVLTDERRTGLEFEVMAVLDMALEHARKIFEVHGEFLVEFIYYEKTEDCDAFWEFQVGEFGGESGDSIGCSFDLDSLPGEVN